MHINNCFNVKNKGNIKIYSNNFIIWYNRGNVTHGNIGYIRTGQHTQTKSA